MSLPWPNPMRRSSRTRLAPGGPALLPHFPTSEASKTRPSSVPPPGCLVKMSGHRSLRKDGLRDSLARLVLLGKAYKSIQQHIREPRAPSALLELITWIGRV